MYNNRRLKVLLRSLALAISAYVFLKYTCKRAKILVVLIKSNIQYSIFERGLLGCSLRKHPLVQLIGSHSASVMWETNCACPDMQFLYAFAAEARPPQIRSSRVPSGQEEAWERADDHRIADNIERTEISPTAFLYRVVLNNIPSNGSRYCRYEVRFGNVSKKFSFRLANSDCISASIVADNQMGSAVFYQICHQIRKKKPNVVMHLGDMVQRAQSFKDWQVNFFDPVRQIQDIPFIIAKGNHDKGSIAEYIQTRFFSLSVGHARVIVLDSNDESDEQARWLETELASASSREASFRIVLVHIPPFIEFWDPLTWPKERGWTTFVRTKLLPLFEKHRVDVIISGHQHNYQRGFRSGMHFWIMGGAGGRLDDKRVEDYFMYRKTIFKHHFGMMEICKEHISTSVYSEAGLLLDNHFIPRAVTRKFKPSEMI